MSDDFAEYADEVRSSLKPDPFMSCFKPLDAFEEQEATWLVPGFIPDGQITLIAGDGGIGKTTLWISIAAAISSGKRCFLDPPGYERDPATVAFVTTEDSIRKKLRRKIRESGADLARIVTMDLAADKTGQLRDFKFGSDKMARFIRETRPALCIFDPVQGFVPADLNMGSRNAMRDCLAPLVALGEETKTTFILIAHSNKRKMAWGRDRISDSADLWDICRSVLMVGTSEEDGLRYISHEKSNYAQPQTTILFDIDDAGQIVVEGTSWKRDRNFVTGNVQATGKPKVEEAKEWIASYLTSKGGDALTREMEADAKNCGFSPRTLRRAKDLLKDAGTISYYQTGTKAEKTWRIRLTGFVELPDGQETPFSV